jgi:protein TonB
MRACPCPPYARDSGDTRAKRRFGAALLISALVHALLSTGITPGSAGRSAASPAAGPAPIAVRLVIPEAELPVTTSVARAAPLRELAPLYRAREEITARPKEMPSVPPAHPAGAGPAAIADPTYYPARQLDVYPALAGALEVRYPGAADSKGRVLLLVLIDAAGLVDDVSVVESEAVGYLEDDARRALKAARFKPALRGGLPVKSRLLVEIDYGAQERTQ